jgi:release factor glutamine methyltransferase
MQQAIRHIQEELATVYSGNELSAITRLLLCHITGFDYTGLLVNKNTIFSEKQNGLLNFYLQELKKMRPIQYVLGYTEFYGQKFNVDESVLIPRPETEELVEWIINESASDISILDIGTGSGCIPVSLKHKLPDSNVWACDISAEALVLAQRNATQNNTDIHFFECDILDKVKLKEQFDVIVSNPPYIPDLEMSEMESHVVDYEPHIALFVPNKDPLLFYREIAGFALKHLVCGGRLYFETHRRYARDCFSLLESMNFCDIELKKDIHGNERMIRAIRR